MEKRELIVVSTCSNCEHGSNRNYELDCDNWVCTLDGERGLIPVLPYNCCKSYEE